MHFPEVKEALYSRCTILVEGETEYGSFPYFAKTLGINFDYYGICLINARGESSITKISQLIRRFHIPTVCLYDRDVMVENPKPYVFYTDYICYEMDVVQACISSGRFESGDTFCGRQFRCGKFFSCEKSGTKTWHGSWFLSAEKAV